MIVQRNFGEIGFFIDSTEGGSRLAITNISDRLEHLAFREGGREVFLTTGSDELPKSEGISIFYEVRKPDRVARPIFDSMRLLVGSIAAIRPLEGEPESLYLSVDFGMGGKQDITLVNTDPSKIVEGKLVVAVTNLKRECIHDQTGALICFKNSLGKNIPFETTEPVLEGSRFTVLG